MRPILRLAVKDLRLLWRDRFGMFWVLLFPVLMALFFGAIFGSEGGGRAAMRVAVVDKDQSDFSTSFVARLDSSAAVVVVHTTEDSARLMVRQARATAYLLLKPGFGKMENMFAGKSAFMIAGVDPSRQAEAGYLQGLITQAWFETMQQTTFMSDGGHKRLRQFMDSLRVDTNLSPRQSAALFNFFGSLDTFMSQLDTGVLATRTDSSNSSRASRNMMSGPKIEFEDVTIDRAMPHSSWEIVFPQGCLWSLLGCAATFGISMMAERVRGTLTRLRLAPISRAQILGGKGLACFICSVGVTTCLLIFAKIVFQVRTPSVALLAAAIAASAICIVGLMMLISVLGKTIQAVAGTGWALLLVMSMLGGGMVPLMFMPKWMAALSNISPVKWGILALEGAIWRGFSAAEMLRPLAILVGVGVVMFSLGVLVLRRTEA